MTEPIALRIARLVIGHVPFPGRYVAADAAGRWLAPSSGIARGRIDRYCVEFDLRDEMQRQMLFGLYDPPLTRLLRVRLREGMVFYDVGANVGYFTLLASALVGQRGEVHAFEPVPANSGRINRNVRGNGIANVTLNEVAVADGPGTITLYAADEITNSGWASVVPSPRRPREQVVPTCSLDAYVFDGDRRRPDLVKIDIEGSEPRALAGMHRLLTGDAAPDLIVEANPFLLERAGLSPSAIVDPLLAAGYTLHRLTRRGLSPLPPGAPFLALTDLYASKQPGALPRW